MHVPGFIHREFQRTAPDDFDLMAWYSETDLDWADQPIGDDGPTFWRARWREEHGTTQRTDAQLQRASEARGPVYHDRPVRPHVPMTAQETAEAEERAVEDGYEKVDGRWRKR